MIRQLPLLSTILATMIVAASCAGGDSPSSSPRSGIEPPGSTGTAVPSTVEASVAPSASPTEAPSAESPSAADVLAVTTGGTQEHAPGDEEFAADKEARALATPDYSTTVFASPDEVPHREHPFFLDKSGFIEVATYDDRHLTEEEKREDPLVNPNWGPFADCVAAEGLEVRDDPAEPYTQADLDRLIALVNEAGPFEIAGPQGLVYQGTPNSDAFVQCAEGHLR